MAFYTVKTSPLAAVQQTPEQNAPGVETVPVLPGGIGLRHADSKLETIEQGDYVVLLDSGDKLRVQKNVFEALFKPV